MFRKKDKKSAPHPLVLEGHPSAGASFSGMVIPKKTFKGLGFCLQ
nr:MAG TPA: hypothetical protein [Inoviridae sp.]